MELTKEELQHLIWKKIESHLQSRIEVCRLINDRTSTTESETQVLRGEIKAYKSILRLDKEFKD